MALKELQEALIASITGSKLQGLIEKQMIPGGALSKESCLKAYQNDYSARLSQTLGENFESLWTILGDKDFFDICQDYIKKYPSKSYDLAQYGDRFPEFLKGHELPYLTELAQLEIEFRRLFNSALEVGLTTEDFSEVSDPTALKFSLTKNIFLSRSSYPIYKIWELRGKNEEEDFSKLIWESEYFIMFNSSGTVEMKYLSLFQYQILLNLCSAKTLEDSLEVETSGDESEVSELFSFLVSNSLILKYS